MVRKWKLGATGTALLATAFVVVACSSSSDDDSTSNGAHGGKGGSGGAAAGKGGTGGSTGGTGGSTGGTGGSTGGTGGSTGGTGGTTGGSAGMMSSGGAAGASTFACTSPTTLSCNYITTWGTFSNGMFGGGLYVYGDLTQDMTDTGEFHVTGTVGNTMSDYSGLGVYFNSCTDVSAYSAVTFTLAGTSTNMSASSLWFIIQQNSTEPPDAKGMKGGCPGAAGNPCQSPYAPFVVSSSPQTINFSSLAGGATAPPATTDGKFDPKQAVGMQWQFRPETAAAYTVDVKLDNLMFGTATSSGSGGMGAGGASSGGASSGGASSGGASSGGASSGGASSGGKAGSGSGGAAADMASMIECTASSMAGMGGASSGGAAGTGSGGAPTGGMGGATGGRGGQGGAGGATGGRGGNGMGGRGGRGTAGGGGRGGGG
jgi:hypothetical protein